MQLNIYSQICRVKWQVIFQLTRSTRYIMDTWRHSLDPMTNWREDSILLLLSVSQKSKRENQGSYSWLHRSNSPAIANLLSKNSETKLLQTLIIISTNFQQAPSRQKSPKVEMDYLAQVDMWDKALYLSHRAEWGQSRAQRWRRWARRGSRCTKAGSEVCMIRRSRVKKKTMKHFWWMLMMMKRLIGCSRINRRRISTRTVVETLIHQGRDRGYVGNQNNKSRQRERNRTIHLKTTMKWAVTMRDPWI